MPMHQEMYVTSLSEDVIILANFPFVDDGDPSGITSTRSIGLELMEKDWVTMQEST